MAESADSPNSERHGRASHGHGSPSSPSDWVRRFAPLVPKGGGVLDIACGTGRHTRFFHALGHPVTAVDIDLSPMADLRGRPGIELIEADLENGPWPFAGRCFAALVIANYLWRPLFPRFVDALMPGGVLLYETFARGNERFGKPANPDHLLAPGELLELARGRLHVVAYEHGIVDAPRQAAVQRLAAVKLPPDPDQLTILSPPYSTKN